MLKNNEAIGYAHVDFCKNTQKKWFGICLLPNYQMQGYGSIMINFILNNKKVKNTDDLFLTVDVNNKYAIKLYEKYNFKLIEENDKFFTMKLQLSN
jgi:ribosomal protein S18 acetylase RimI-like enzyme